MAKGLLADLVPSVLEFILYENVPNRQIFIATKMMTRYVQIDSLWWVCTPYCFIDDSTHLLEMQSRTPCNEVLMWVHSGPEEHIAAAAAAEQSHLRGSCPASVTGQAAVKKQSNGKVEIRNLCSISYLVLVNNYTDDSLTERRSGDQLRQQTPSPQGQMSEAASHISLIERDGILDHWSHR